ncbi:MAG: hypothetical protein F4X02_03815 [Chloroflexi bacterium]|nr:hypothetical protein [Chloroflexota bacterium]
MDFAGVDRQENPYHERAAGAAEKAQSALNHVAEAIKLAQETQPPDGILPACTDLERRFLKRSVVPVFEQMKGFNFLRNTLSDVLDYVAEQLKWRDKHWSNLPYCREAYELGQIMFNYVNDFAKIQIIEQTAAKFSILPFTEAGLTSLSQYEFYLKLISDPLYLELPTCRESALYQPLLAVVQQHEKLNELPADTEQDLLAFAEAHFRWRDSLLDLISSLPACAEALDIALLAFQLSSDSLTGAALSHSRAGLPEMPILYEHRYAKARERIRERMVVLGGLDTLRTDSSEAPLPMCSWPEMQEQIDSARSFADLLNLSAIIERDLLFAEHIVSVFDWRETLLVGLPGCSPAFEFALLMIGALGDANAAQALKLAGFPDAQNRFTQQINASLLTLRRRWQQDVAPLQEAAAGE